MNLIGMKSHQFGQGLAEYAIIVALIAVAAIGVLGFFSDTVTAQISGISQDVVSYDGVAEQTAATANVDTANAPSQQPAGTDRDN